LTFNPVTHHAAYYPQIENWVLPSFAFALWCVVRYVGAPTQRAMTWIAVAAAVVFNLRLQNAFFAAALGLVALVAVTTMWDRFRHLVVFGVIFALVGVAPWTVRNYVVDGRVTPGSAQSAEQMAITNDPRIGFYGLRYWEGYTQLQAEWESN